MTLSTMSVGGLAGVPISGVAAFFGLVAVAFGIVGKKLSRKISKHEKTISFAEAKNRTISRLVSKSFNDGGISDSEFKLILNEIEQYYQMKVVP